MRFKDSIEVWQQSAVTDGYAGNTTSETQLGESWCNISTLSREKYTDYGLDVPSLAIEVYLRTRDDIDYFDESVFFKYNGRRWFFVSIEEYNLSDQIIRIVADGER